MRSLAHTLMQLVLFIKPPLAPQMVHSTGPVLLLLGLSGAMGQVFIFVTISKFGALTCSIIGACSLGLYFGRLTGGGGGEVTHV